MGHPLHQLACELLQRRRSAELKKRMPNITRSVLQHCRTACFGTPLPAAADLRERLQKERRKRDRLRFVLQASRKRSRKGERKGPRERQRAPKALSTNLSWAESGSLSS